MTWENLIYNLLLGGLNELWKLIKLVLFLSLMHCNKDNGIIVNNSTYVKATSDIVAIVAVQQK